MLSSELVRSVLDSAPDAMIIIDPSGRILFANRQVQALFGHRPEDITGREVEVLLPERFRARHIGHRRGYTDNFRVRPMGAGLELYGMRQDGTEFPVEISLSPVSQGDQIMVAAAIRDVTPRKQAEQALKEAQHEAERANLAKSRFLATASHDLRQPLQALGLLNGALRRMVQNADCLDLLAQQEEAVDAMSRLLNALLDISKLESGAIKLELTDFDVAALFEEMRREFAGMAADKGLSLSIDTARAQVHSDPALVGQLLRNLVSNAIKYTRAGRVELRCARAADAVQIEVRDTGIGIPADQIPLIFEEFYQVGVAPNSSRNGYGLGLSIVRRIARLLDVSIEVSSKPGEGSVLSFRLPLSLAPAAAASAPVRVQAEATASGGGAAILLVEDDPGVRNAMRMFLKLEGYRVTPAANFAEAAELLQADEHFDLVVSDYHLEKGRTGTQVIETARGLRGATLKAILVTGDTSSAVRELQCDANLRITSKPINSGEFLRLVKDLLAS